MATVDTSIREKLAKLLNMTTEHGCTEDEAETAMRMAMSLMARYGIERDDLDATTKASIEARVGERVRDRYQYYHILLAQSAAMVYGAKMVTYSAGKEGLEFIGRPENIDAAQETFFWLIRQVDFIYKANLPKGLSQRERSDYRKSFKDNCSHRVYQRVERLVSEMMTNDASAKSTGSTSLVVSNHFTKLFAENEVAMTKHYGRNLRPARARSIRQGSGSGDGRRAGDQVQLHREVAKTPTRLLNK